MVHRHFICRLWVIVVMLIATTTAFADVIRGRVVDSETKEELPDANVKVTEKYSDYGWTTMVAKTDSLGTFTVVASRKATIEVSMRGYYSKTKPVLAFSDSRKDTIDIGTIELKMSPQMLKMVEVKARARRFTVKDDTIVFHPEAFHLQEGARLDELISKLPGVEVDDDGNMSWNGKPIRLTMDGESMLGGEDLMKQLPAEAVQDIKAYNKASEFSERTGRDDGTQDMVLDLTIKPGFLDKWYGDVRAGYQTPNYYEGELSMNRLSKSDPVLVYADANNVNTMHRKYMSRSMTIWSGGFGQEQGASAGYQHRWKKKEGTQEMKSEYSFSGGVAHDDNWRSSRTETENYFPNTAANRTKNGSYNRNHQLNPTLFADLRWAKDSLNTYSLNAKVEYAKFRSNGHETSEQEEHPNTNTQSDDYIPILSQFINNNSEGHQTKLETQARWDHYIKDGSLGATLTLNYSDRHEDSWTSRTIESHQQSITSSRLDQFSTTPTTAFYLNAEIHHNRWLTKNWMVQMRYDFRNTRNRSNRDFQTNGVADAANSFRNCQLVNSHSLNLSQTINLTPLQLMPNITASWKDEHQDYLRGSLDTAAVRRYWLIDPSLRATLKVTKTAGFELNYSYSTSKPGIMETIGYRDLTNPLYISEGNPFLKDTHTHSVSLNYNMVLARSQTTLSASAGMRSSDHERTSTQSYNPTTAVYVSRPENVKGSKSWDAKVSIDQALGDYFRLQNDVRLGSSRRYAYMTRVPTQTDFTLTRQTSFSPSDKLKLSYDKDWLKASVYANIDANRLRHTATPEQNTTLWNNSFGFEAEITYGDFVFQTSLNELTSRGYADPAMNRNRLLWDGSVTWKILQKKASLKLLFKDILNNEDGYFSSQSAYQRITSWYDSHHNYIGISFLYHLDAKAKE